MNDYLNTYTIRRRCPEGTVFCRIVSSELDGDPPPTFIINVGKAGSRISAQADMIARTLGAAVRSGADIDDLIGMTEGIAHVDSNGPEEASSLPDAVAQSLKEYRRLTKESDDDLETTTEEA